MLTPAEEIPIQELTPYKLVRRGICPCGHPLVQEFVPDGKIYFFEQLLILPYTLTCGGCKKTHPVRVGIVVEDGKRCGKMPIDCLEEMPGPSAPEEGKTC